MNSVQVHKSSNKKGGNMMRVCISAIIVLMAMNIGLYAQKKDAAQDIQTFGVKLIQKETIETNEIVLPNGEIRILYASRSDYDSLLGPHRGEGFLKGWCSENGKYVGFADYVGTNTNFSFLDANKQVLWQKKIELQVVHAKISNSGKIAILFVGYFDTYHIERVEIRDSTGQLITTIQGGAAGGLAAFSESEQFGLFVSHDFWAFNNTAKVIWNLPNAIRQNFVISDDGNYAALFSPMEKPSPASGITFVKKGTLTKHHSLPLSPYGGAKGYVSSSDDYLLLTDRDIAYLFDFKSGDLIWQKTIGNCILAEWIEDYCLLVIDSIGTRTMKSLNIEGDILFQKDFDEITDDDAQRFKYWTKFLESNTQLGERYLVLPPNIYVFDIYKDGVEK
jgi:hypothetical protein